MFRLHKTKPPKSGERVEFKFSHFKVDQVPKGWDKLFVSIISVETGKSVGKSGKAIVKNGNCQWSENVSQSIWVSHDNGSSKETDQQCLFKLVVAMGSTKSGILGEATVNMASYMTSNATVPVSFPLTKNNNGTTLQVRIQCLTPRTKLSDEEPKSTSGEDDVKETFHEEPDGKHANNEVSSYPEDLEFSVERKQNGEMEASLPTSNSGHNYDSAADSIEKESLSSSNNLNVNDHRQIGRLDSSVSLNSLPAGSHPEDDQCQSSNSSFNSRITYSDNHSQDDPGECAPPSVGISSSSKSLLETAEDTIEELRKEAKTWERNARKLMLDFDTLKKEYLEQSKTQASLEIELSAACAEREGLQKEVEQIKLLLEKSVAEQAELKDSTLRREEVSHLAKELETEIKFQEESNANLSMQLKRSQESNAELVAVLQELEETIVKQKAEIETLSCLQPQVDYIDDSFQEISEKNRNLMIQIQKLQESEKNLKTQLKELEQAFEERNQHTQNGSSGEHFSTSMKKKDSCAGMGSVNEGSGDLIREIEELKLKLQELESDCQELTDENLDLLLKLKETKNNSNGTNQECEFRDLEEKVRMKFLQETENGHRLFTEEFDNLKLEQEGKVAKLSAELNEKKADIAGLEADLLSKEKEIRDLQKYQQELESKLDVLQKEKDQIQENMANFGRESDISAKCMIDLQNDLTILTRRLDSQVSANKSLEMKFSELERAKQDLELHLSETTEENKELSACISGLEAQLSSLTEEAESTSLKLECSKSLSGELNNEITQLRKEMETREMDLEEKLQEKDKQFSEAQRECEYLCRENQNLQAITDNLTEEYSSLQKSNGVLKKKNLELQENCKQMEEKWKESHRNFADCFMKVNILEQHISSTMEESESKEKILASELDLLLKKANEQTEQLNLLNKMYSEKKIETESLQQELSDLSMQLSAVKEERGRVASEAVQDLSGPNEVISKLESELNAVETEYQVKIQDLMDKLANSKQNQEILRADNKRILKMLANYQSCEDDFKTSLNDLELKLTVSEYERQQVAEESNNLKAQLLKTESLQDGVVALKNELKAIKMDKAKLQSSFDEVFGERKKLKEEKSLLLEEITNLKKSASKLEDCKQNRITLEQKLLQMEHDLMAKEALCEQDVELKKEISRARRANKQLQEQIQQLEEDNHKCKSRAQSLEKELLLTKEEQNQREFKDGANKNEIDPATKIKSLEDELEKANKANQTLKIQMKRLMSEGRKARIGSLRKPTAEGEVVPRGKFERAKSSLETELIDLRERYLNMSLKYAQVEAEREELVMKLKATNNSKRWF